MKHHHPKTSFILARSFFWSVFARWRWALTLGVVSWLSALTASQAVAQIDHIAHQPWVKIAQATGNGWMHFPRAISYETLIDGEIGKKLLVNWQTNADVVMFPMSHGWAGSINKGVTWDAPAPTNTPEIDMMASVKLNTDGTLIAIPFYPNHFTGATPKTSFSFTYHTSVDGGTTWTAQTNAGLVDFGTQQVGLFRFHRGIVQNIDGTLYAPAYAQYRLPSGSYETHRALLMQSTNGGANWTPHSTIVFVSGVSYNETALVRCKDGSLLAVIRSAAANPLRYARSTDEGLTWTPVANLPGVPAHAGRDPHLHLMPNGILVLSYGNNVPGNMRHVLLAFSPDGNGEAWSPIVQTYTSSTVGLGNKSSGYTSVAPITAHRFLQFSDRALYTYYSATNQHPTPNPFSIWKKVVDIVPDLRNRIDLKTKFDEGAITVETDLTSSETHFPEARPAGAFDGSTEYWSSAFKAGTGATSGTYTIDLQKNHLLDAMGVALKSNNPQSAVIEVAEEADGPWTTVKTYDAATHQALDYTSFPAIAARYVRLNLSGEGALVLNEVELYSTTATFENEAPGTVPDGYVATNGGFAIGEDPSLQPFGYQSTRALVLNDSDSSAATGNKIIRRTGLTPTETKTLEFWLKIQAYAADGAIQWGLTSGEDTVFRFAVFPDGSLHYRDGDAWVDLKAKTLIGLDTWTLIRVEAEADKGKATIYLGDEKFDNVKVEKKKYDTLDGFFFGSTGDTATGDKALFDDVSFN